MGQGPGRAAAGFEAFDHTADVGLRAWGPDLAAAFAQAARGLFSLLVPLEAVQEETVRELRVEAGDPESLLVAWIDELLFVFETERLVFARFEVQLTEASALTATAHGEAFDPARHRGGVVVKAATYHQIGVLAGPPARVQIILDIRAVAGAGGGTRCAPARGRVSRSAAGYDPLDRPPRRAMPRFVFNVGTGD